MKINILIATFLLGMRCCCFSQRINKADTVLVLPNDSYDNFPKSNNKNRFPITISDSGKINLNQLNYFEIVKYADSLFKLLKYEQSLLVYLFAFQKNNDLGQVVHRYRAAICYASVNDVDGAFNQLIRIAGKGKYYNHFQIINEPAFNKLHDDKRWIDLIRMIKQNVTELGEQFINELPKNEQ
jgi:hypothetical protein